MCDNCHFASLERLSNEWKQTVRNYGLPKTGDALDLLHTLTNDPPEMRDERMQLLIGYCENFIARWDFAEKQRREG